MAGKNLGGELGMSGGEWLFRQEGLVLGPVPASQIIEMLFSGALDGRSEIAPMGSSAFQPLAEVDYFKIHWAKAEAKRRVDLADAQDRVHQAKKRNLRLALIGATALVLAVGAGVAATQLAIHNPWKDSDELAFADISMEPPVISVARAQAVDEELIAYPGKESAQKPRSAPADEAAKATSKPGKPDRPGKRAVASASARPVEDPSEPDGLSMKPQFDMGEINATVASRQKSLYPCFVEEAQRTPGLAARIPLEFVIGNDGRVARLWIDHPQFKSGPLFECLLAELKKWPFKAYEGERATVNLSFNIGKKT